jgi:hypothetical protein
MEGEDSGGENDKLSAAAHVSQIEEQTADFVVVVSHFVLYPFPLSCLISIFILLYEMSE